MHIPRNYPGHLRFARAILTTLSLIAGAALTYRIWRASAFGILEAFTSLGTGIAIVAAVGAGWLVHARDLRNRAEQAEQKAEQAEQEVVQLRAGLLEGDEDRTLWDSVDPAAAEHDTIGFDRNVIAINQARFKQAG